MATWKDGAAYAPIERPDGFAAPVADPLPEAAPYSSGTSGTGVAPAGFDTAEQPPLDSFAAEPSETRDPRESFSVVQVGMTSVPGASTGDRDPREPFATQSYDTPAASTPLAGPPQGPPLGPPVGPPLEPAPQTWPAPTPQTWPAPTPQGWPAPTPRPLGGQDGRPLPPPPMPMQPRSVAPQARTPDAAQQHRRLAQIAGALCLAGFLFPSAAPFLLIVAGAMGLRTMDLTRYSGPIALGIGVVAILGQLLAGSLGQSNSLTGLAALALAFAFLTLTMRKLQ